jgi:hypothetical protein
MTREVRMLDNHDTPAADLGLQCSETR